MIQYPTFDLFIHIIIPLVSNVVSIVLFFSINIIISLKGKRQYIKISSILNYLGYSIFIKKKKKQGEGN
jgi:uncharacterized protein YebE (UPF0316 family)